MAAGRSTWMVWCSILVLLQIADAKAQPTERSIYRTVAANVRFTSDAPQEFIEATNSAATGVLDIRDRKFAISVPVRSFEGFNSPLQQEHFNENYLESDEFPNITFTGRIIEDIDLVSDGSATVRAKGLLTVHGIPVERIINCSIVVNEHVIRVSSNFFVALEDHAIRIPRIVQLKIASEIEVEVSLRFSMQPGK